MADESTYDRDDRGGRGYSQRSSSQSGGSRGPQRRYQNQNQNQNQQNNTNNPNNRRRRFQRRRKVCLYCAEKDKVIHWKNTDDFRRFVGGNGEIYPRRKSGLCAKHQRQIAVAIKRARHIALLPYTSEHVRITGRH